jgi:gamma-glutamylcyclotransferase (GGCT)/AIG2-like uncharacterized protein YtfP
MKHHVFVYGTLLAGEVNHDLLCTADLLGPHRTDPCFTMFDLGAYPGVTRNGGTAICGEVYRVDAKGLERLDRLEAFPQLYDRELIGSPFGRAWIYLYRGSVNGRSVIRSGNWRKLAGGVDSFRAAGVRAMRDPRNPRWRKRFGQ